MKDKEKEFDKAVSKHHKSLIKEQEKKKRKIVFGCYFCEKGVDSEELAVDKEGNCIMSTNPKLTDNDNHFICKKCYEKVDNFFDVKEEK